MVLECQQKLNCKMLFMGEDNSCGITRKNVVNHAKRVKVTNCGSKHIEGNVSVKESIALNPRKRKPEVLEGGKGSKMQKINFRLRHQLRRIVKELMNHDAGWIFSEPVDPVKLKIPDYPSIVKKPMDLGTILRKLEGNDYSDADEVVADVRLTFSNAMLYNPVWHEVHRWARTLETMFIRKWESVEATMEQPKKNCEQATDIDSMKTNVENNHRNVISIALKKAQLPTKHGTCTLMSYEEKQKFRLELVQVISRQMVEKLQTVFQKYGLVGLNKEKLGSYIDSTDDETLLKLRREVKAVLSAKDGKVQSGKNGLKCFSSLKKAVEKASAEHELSIYSDEYEPPCVSLKHHHRRTVAAPESASDLSSERLEEHNHYADSELEHKVKYDSELPPSICGPEYDGHVVADNESKFNQPALMPDEDCSTTLSPKRALRAAILKSRFADMIFKAKLQKSLNHNSDPMSMQQEKERLEREKQKEKDKAAAQIKAAEAATRRKEQNCLKIRKRERDAARMALLQLKKCVEFENNSGILEDLKDMGCGFLYEPWKPHHHRIHLQKFGLFCKDDSLEDDDDSILNIEEGEILL